MFCRVALMNTNLTVKCKLKCYVKPTKDSLGVNPSKGNQGTTRDKEKTLFTSVGIEPTTSRLGARSFRIFRNKNLFRNIFLIPAILLLGVE